MLCIALSQDVRLSVCLSVTRRYSIETAKYIIKFFSLLDNHTILVFLHQTVWQYSDEVPLTGASNTRGYDEIAIFDQYILLCLGNDTRQLPRSANRKPYQSFRMVRFTMTLNDLE